jgi:hypothetical protein
MSVFLWTFPPLMNSAPLDTNLSRQTAPTKVVLFENTVHFPFLAFSKLATA